MKFSERLRDELLFIDYFRLGRPSFLNREKAWMKQRSRAKVVKKKSAEGVLCNMYQFLSYPDLKEKKK